MSNYKIIDAHAHIFPEKIAYKATAAIGDFYSIPMNCIGSTENLLESGKKIDVLKYLVCSTATVKEQVIPINNFIYEQVQKHSDLLIGFGTLHPSMDNLVDEVKRVVSLGFKGIKLHPDFQKFDIDDPEVLYMYEAIEKYKLAVLIHVGDEHYTYSSPDKIVNIANKYPSLIILASHFGGYRCWNDIIRLYNNIENVYFDTSSSLEFIDYELARKIIKTIGHKKFFFGSDYPMWTHEKELERFLELNLTELENQDILYNNFANLFGI